MCVGICRTLTRRTNTAWKLKECIHVSAVLSCFVMKKVTSCWNPPPPTNFPPCFESLWNTYSSFMKVEANSALLRVFRVFTRPRPKRHGLFLFLFLVCVRGGVALEWIWSKLWLLSISFCQTSGFHVRPPPDHLSQIRQTDQKDQTSRSVWVWLTNFANFAKIAFKQRQTH